MTHPHYKVTVRGSAYAVLLTRSGTDSHREVVRSSKAYNSAVVVGGAWAIHWLGIKHRPTVLRMISVVQRRHKRSGKGQFRSS